ncbi:Plastin-2 [Taenia solium]|eukprot:TsM_001194600 transcript=TsM_001194600 gene=TsM_001194600
MRTTMKTYRNWINSMGLRTVVHSLYGDLFSGTVIFKLYDLIKSGSVDWLRVNRFFSTAPAKANFQHLGKLAHEQNVHVNKFTFHNMLEN